MRTVDQDLIHTLKEQARNSARLRAHFTFHQPEEVVQRMVNVMIHGSYVPPHKHVNPDKVEHFVILEGAVACVVHDDEGEVVDYAVMSTDKGVMAVDLLPGTNHTFVCLTQDAVLMEFIQGPYDPATHKKPATFAPAEGTQQAATFVSQLERYIRLQEKIV